MEGSNRRATVAVLALAALLAGVHYALLGDVGLNPSDEGFLWYGLLRMQEGLFPVRDFQSYEPGRYWVCLAVWKLFGAGILQMRLALALVQALGLFSGLSVLRRFVRPAWLLVPLGVALAAWMFPRHKMFEPALAMGACHVTLLFLERPGPRRAFGLGLFVGLAACIGRNHGAYGLAGTLLALGLSAWRERRRGVARELLAWGGGIAAGYAPMLLCMALVPGFASSFVELVRFYVEQGTNQPLPYPWPWRLGYSELGGPVRAAVAFAFLLPPLAYGLGAAVLLRRRAAAEAWRPLLACTCIGLVYAHHAAVRSDAAHLAQCFEPALLGWLALPAALAPGVRRRVASWGSVLLLALCTAAATPSLNPLFAAVLASPERDPLLEREAGGQTLRVPRSVASLFDGHRALLERFDPGAREALFAPFFPTVYPYCGVRSPVGIVYFLWRFDEARQEELVAKLDGSSARLAVVLEVELDGDPRTRFESTNPRLMEYLESAWRREEVGIPPGVRVYVRP